MTKKKITVLLFVLLMLITVALSVMAAVNSYYEDLNKENALIPGFGAFICIFFGVLAVLYEADLLYTVCYFAFKPKSNVKTVLNILADASFLLVFLTEYFNIYVGKNTKAPFICFGAFVLFRIVYIIKSRIGKQ